MKTTLFLVSLIVSTFILIFSNTFILIQLLKGQTLLLTGANVELKALQVCLEKKQNPMSKVRKKHIADTYPSETPKAELKAMKRRCWNTGCQNRAWLIDWTGYHYCLRHWWSSYRWGGGEISVRSFFRSLSNTKIY